MNPTLNLAAARELEKLAEKYQGFYHVYAHTMASCSECLRYAMNWKQQASKCLRVASRLRAEAKEGAC